MNTRIQKLSKEGVARELRRIRINLQGTIAAEGSDGSPECSALLEEAMTFQEAFSRRLQDKPRAMTCNTASRLAVPRVELLRSGMHDHSDVDSTVVGDRSDQDTLVGRSTDTYGTAGRLSMEKLEQGETEDLQCVVVRGTFLEVLDDGQCMMQRYRKMRKAKTDFASKAGTQE
eukprot:s4763_g1.t1